MKSLVRFALAIALCVLPLQLRAGFLDHSVTLTFETPSPIIFVPVGEPEPGPVITSFGTQTVGAGVEFPDAMVQWDIDLADGSIRFVLDTPEFTPWMLFIANPGFHGFRIHDADGTLPDIVGVSIGFDSHVGLDPAKVSFTADDILIDMSIFVDSGWFFGVSGECQNAPPGLCQELPRAIRQFVPEFVLNVEFAAVPLPATPALVGAGLLLLAGWRRKR